MSDLEFAMVPDRLLLVEATEIVEIAGMKIGSTEPGQPQLHIGFTGRINNSAETTTFWVAMSPEDALASLVDGVMDSIEQMRPKEGGA